MRRQALVPFYITIFSALAAAIIFTSSAASSQTATTNVSQLPKGNQGTTQFLVEPSPYSVRSGQSRDTFRTRIRFTHFLKDDPIVFPGQPGASHLHMFFGNALVNSSTTPDNIRTNCSSAAAGGTANCTGYWVPALFDANANVVLPDQVNEPLIYYKAAYDIPDPTQIVAIPPGLRMIAGDKNATPSSPQTDNKAQFECYAVPGTKQPYIVDCPQGSIVEMSITFPRCWDGQNLDSPDHKSHMAYANNGCPASHPVIFPEISFHFRFPVNSSKGTAGWRLSSDMYDSSLSGGYSLHADWFGGWDPAVMARWIKNCDQAQVDCVVDLLGDGTQLGSEFL